MYKALAAAVLFAGPLVSAVAQPIVLDGAFDDWDSAELESEFHVEDPRGDSTGTFDVLELSGGLEGQTLLLDLRLATALNLQSGPEEHGTLVLTIGLGDGRELSIDFRGRQALLDGEPLSWTALRFEALPTYASDRQELRLDLGGVGWPGTDQLTIGVSGSDSVEAVVLHPEAATSRPATAPAEGPLLPDAPASAGSFRHANMNVLWDGLADAERGPKLARLIAAADADVMTFQEAIAQADQDEPNPAAASAGTAAVLEQRVGGRWNAVADGRGCAVVSRHPLRAVPLGEEVRGAAAIVDLPGDAPDPIVVSVHLKCCGYAGNKDDDRRVEQVTALARALRPLRDHHPIVIAGDYNLVGSSRPLDVLTGPALELRDLVPLQAIDGSATRWRGLSDEESFWPGRLDLITYSASLKPTTKLILDAAELPAAELQRLKLQPDDSLGSDHLLLVADFERDRE